MAQFEGTDYRDIEARKKGWKVGGYIASPVRKQREMNTVASSTFTILFSSRLQV